MTDENPRYITLLRAGQNGLNSRPDVLKVDHPRLGVQRLDVYLSDEARAEFAGAPGFHHNSLLIDLLSKLTGKSEANLFGDLE